jgi:hypothetical protein
MTRRGQYSAVIGILIGCLAVTAFSAIGARAFRRSPAAVTEGAAAPARFDDVEPALARLLGAARRHTAGADTESRAELERALARFGEACAPLGSLRPGVTAREASQVVETARDLTQRIQILAREIAAVPGPRTDRPGPDKLALLTRLAEKVRAALGQLREARAVPAVAGMEKIARLGPSAAEAVIPEGVAVLFLTVACAVSMALVSWRRYLQ